MDNYRAVAVAEGFEEPSSEDEVREAWQWLVDSGLAWQLQGWFGRTAHALIQAGKIEPPDPARCRPKAKQAPTENRLGRIN